jgi:Fe-S-cluster containining protein
MTSPGFYKDNLPVQAESEPVFHLIDFSDAPCVCDDETTVTGTVSVFGTVRYVSVGIQQRHAGVCDLMPLAWTLCDVAVREALDRARAAGKRVGCGPRCSACCRYLVPLSLPEAIILYDEVQSRPPEQRRALWDSSLSVARRLLENGTGGVPDGGAALEDLSAWYHDKQVACPFLEADLCGVYDRRPLACREYLTTTPSHCCDPENGRPVERLKLPFSVLESLGRLVARLEGGAVEAIMLPLVLPWVHENRDRFNQKWPAGEMVQAFLQSLAS